MFAAQRRHAILERLRAHGSATIAELTDAVDASEVTVRRDLRTLEADGQLVRRRGGASIVRTGADGLEGPAGDGVPALAQKRAIAKLASTLVEDGDAVLLGAGTTTQQLADRLVGVRNLTVVTNSLLVGESLARSAEAGVVLTGGSLHGSSLALVGSTAEQSLAGLHARRAFLSGAGLTTEGGLSVASMSAAGVDRAIAQAAAEVLVLVDSSKLGRDSLFRTVEPERIAHLVTDDGADPDTLDAIARLGAVVHVAHVSI